MNELLHAFPPNPPTSPSPRAGSRIKRGPGYHNTRCQMNKILTDWIHVDELQLYCVHFQRRVGGAPKP